MVIRGTISNGRRLLSRCSPDPHRHRHNVQSCIIRPSLSSVSTKAKAPMPFLHMHQTPITINRSFVSAHQHHCQHQHSSIISLRRLRHSHIDLNLVRRTGIANNVNPVGLTLRSLSSMIAPKPRAQHHSLACNTINANHPTYTIGTALKYCRHYPIIAKRDLSNNSLNKKKKALDNNKPSSGYFDNTLTALQSIHQSLKSNASIDIWTINVVLLAFILGPVVWNPMKNSTNPNDEIPVDDPVEHSGKKFAYIDTSLHSLFYSLSLCI